MRTEILTRLAPDGASLTCYHWRADGDAPPRAVLHIAHGMAEHAARYARLATALTEAGFVVYANDHRGHGKSVARPEDLGWFAGQDGFETVVHDLTQHLEVEAEAWPGLPIVLLGHSMGATIALRAAEEVGENLTALALSGATGVPSPLARAGRYIARVERRLAGPRGFSRLIGRLSFQEFNKRFAPNRTDFDWLSRDPEEVDLYVNDPRCGFECTTELWVTMLDGLSRSADPREIARLPKRLPIYLFSGGEDPVSERCKSVLALIELMQGAGLSAVSHRIYPGARHEVFNEINRGEVTKDLVRWLAEAVPA